MTAVRIFLAMAVVALTAWGAPAAAGELDQKLSKIIRAYGLLPLETKPFERTQKFVLGQALFFDPILSGNRDVACATCHLLRRGTSDALALSVGVAGSGLGEERRLARGELEHPRNSLDLWNRDNNAVRRLFWDGRVEATGNKGFPFDTPLGERIPAGLENALAAQALFPLVRSDEMLGHVGDRASEHLPAEHALLPNELATNTEHLQGATKSLAIYDLILERLLGNDKALPTPTQANYRGLFAAAFPARAASQITIAEVANAISHFEEMAFATRQTPWDRYLTGDVSAVSDWAKRGAIVFFGRGKCAVCHSGPLFSDFEFHSLLVRRAGPGTDGAGRDLGRYAVTGDPRDKYTFRTPPLRNVTLTSPYFHNGTAATLQEAIEHHLNPLARAGRYEETGAFTYSTEEIEAISPILAPGTFLSEEEVDLLIEFLGALEDPQTQYAERIVPPRVPSGLPVPAISMVQD